MIDIHLLDSGFRRNDEINKCLSFRRKPESRKAEVNKKPAFYILASKRDGTVYMGVTLDLIKRIWEHKNNMVEGFTKRYGFHQLIGMKYTRIWNPLLSERND